jgi:hypothetical protein
MQIDLHDRHFQLAVLKAEIIAASEFSHANTNKKIFVLFR